MFTNVTLEMSLKPFKQISPEYVDRVVELVFTQWRPLLKNRKIISIMLWTADGSEILDYQGDLSGTFDWSRYMGDANKPTRTPEDDPRTSIHDKNALYIKEPYIMTYGKLKEIVSAFKQKGKELYPESEIRVGETFDIGPEFAKSSFKYERHFEIISGKFMGRKCFINSYALLDGDDRRYAGYPDGIPDGTPFGRFLGRQANVFLKDMGFDFLWLSNGVGFCAQSWDSTGAIFDGKSFKTDKLEETKKKVFDFWKCFREECPDIPVETRGTNYSAGIDYASDAVGIYDIYKSGLNILPPPNSPWAALDGNFGLELMGHLSRIAELPDKDFLFRYYIHDPWWINTPWYDRYDGCPHDIYLPMALSRVDENGKTCPASVFNILSIDNTFGDMPDSCVNEPLPHILKAEKDAPDKPSPFVWVYPVREYTTAKTEKELKEMMSGDWFICQSITNGFPLSTVVSTDNFLKNDLSVYSESVLVTPVPYPDSDFEKKILAYADNGGKVLFLGSTEKASEAFLSKFSLENVENSFTGEIEIENASFPDVYRNGKYPRKTIVRDLSCNGGLCASSPSENSIKAGKYALSAEYKNSVWYRATVGGDVNTSGGHLITDDGEKYIKGDVLLRSVIKKFGYDISFDKPKGNSLCPVIMLNRSNNAYIFSVYTPDTTVGTRLSFPLGAPIIDSFEAEIMDGKACYRFPKAVHRECRIFVSQTDGVVGCKEHPPVSLAYRRRIKLTGLENATVRIFGEEYCKANVSAVLNSFGDDWPDADAFEAETVKSEEYGTYYEIRNVSGELMINFPVK